MEVGPSKVKFGIHKGLLCHHSSYFKAALTEGFKEALEGTIALDEDRVDVFKVFNTWLYTGTLCAHEGWTELKNDHNFLTKLYLFSDKRGVPALQNDSIDVIIDGYLRLDLIPCYDICHIWENTVDSSKLRKLVVDFWVRNADFQSVFHLCEKNKHAMFPQDFLFDVLSAISEAKKVLKFQTLETLDPICKDRCDYHIHGKDEPRCK